MVLTGDRGRILMADAFRHTMIDDKEVPELKKRQGLAINGVTTRGLRYTAATRLMTPSKWSGSMLTTSALLRLRSTL